MSLTIKKAGKADLDSIVPLFTGYREFYRQKADPASERAFIEDRLVNADSVIFIAMDAKTTAPLGFTQLYPMFSSVRMKPIWILNDLFVSESARGQGVAEALMEKAEAFAWGTSAAGLELATEINNTPAQALYEKRGWNRDTEYFHYSLNRP